MTQPLREFLRDTSSISSCAANADDHHRPPPKSQHPEPQHPKPRHLSWHHSTDRDLTRHNVNPSHPQLGHESNFKTESEAIGGKAGRGEGVSRHPSTKTSNNTCNTSVIISTTFVMKTCNISKTCWKQLQNTWIIPNVFDNLSTLLPH